MHLIKHHGDMIASDVYYDYFCSWGMRANGFDTPTFVSLIKGGGY